MKRSAPSTISKPSQVWAVVGMRPDPDGSGYLLTRNIPCAYLAKEDALKEAKRLSNRSRGVHYIVHPIKVAS